MAVQVSSVHFTSLKTGLTCAIQARRLIASSPRPIRYQAAVLLPAQCLLWSALRTQLRHRASSSLGGLRTPAPVRAAPPSWGRHPQTFTIAATHLSPMGCRETSSCATWVERSVEPFLPMPSDGCHSAHGWTEIV